MNIKELFHPVPILEKINWNPHLNVRNITSDSRAVVQDEIFVACPGTRMDGHDFIGQAVLAGAAVVVCEKMPELKIPSRVTFVRVANSRQCLAQLLGQFYRHPDKKVKLIGVTGTNGKTTIAYLLYRLLREKVKTGYIGTLEYELPTQKVKAQNTTPGAEILIPLLSEMEREGAEYCVLEVSSHALDQERVSGLEFELVIFTQLTQDHLDYHLTMERYYQAKRLLFSRMPAPKKMLINRDCPYGRRLLSENLEAQSYGLSEKATYRAHSLQGSFQGTDFVFEYQDRNIPFHIHLPFRHNVANALAVLGAVEILGMEPEAFGETLQTLQGIPGRLEKVSEASEGFDVFVDYAHTPDAFENVLSEARRIGSPRILTVFGCGGDRDFKKRAGMTAVACRYSDIVILTSDNPRSEDPEGILSDMRKGIPAGGDKKPQIYKILDRELAIEKLIMLAQPGDVLFVLGKGHEDYQILGDKKIPLDDRLVVKQSLKRKSRVFFS